MNHIFYQTKTKYTNTGDALINSALINVLRNYGKLYANCSKDVPEEFIKSLGILPEERIDADSEMAFIKAVIKSAKAAKKNGDRVYVFSGLGDMYGGGIKLVIRNFVSGLIFPVFKSFGVTIVRIGRSVGPISRLMAVSEWIRSLFLSHYYVRDTKSLKRCKGMGIKKVEFCPDMSWIYDMDRENKCNQTNTVMVNLRDSIFDEKYDTFSDATLKKCDEILTELNAGMNNQMTVCVAYQIDEDKEFSQKVYEFLKEKYPTTYIDHQMKLDELSQSYKNVDYHISNRMHSLLAGYKYGSLPIALIDKENHTKISATFYDCSLDSLMIDIYDTDSAKSVSSIAENRENLLDKILLCEKENQKRIKDTLDFVFKKEK